MRVLHIHGKGMKELHSAGCTIYDIWQYCTVYDSTALYMTVLHYIWQYCTLWRMQLLCARLHQQQCGPGHQQQPGPAFQCLHTETPHTLTLRYIYTDIWAAQCGDLLLYTFTRIHSVELSYIYTNSWAVQWAPAISFTLDTFIRIRCILYMDNTDKRAVQWASAISFFPLRG